MSDVTWARRATMNPARFAERHVRERILLAILELADSMSLTQEPFSHESNEIAGWLRFIARNIRHSAFYYYVNMSLDDTGSEAAFAIFEEICESIGVPKQ